MAQHVLALVLVAVVAVVGGQILVATARLGGRD